MSAALLEVPVATPQQRLLALDELPSIRLLKKRPRGVLQPKYISPTTSNTSQYLWYHCPSWSVSCAAELVRSGQGWVFGLTVFMLL